MRKKTRAAEQVGEGLQSLRKQHGLTQAEIAERAGLSNDAVSRIERGDREARLGTLERLASVLGVEVVALFGSDREVKPRHQDKITGRLGLLQRELDKLDSDTAEAILDGCLAIARSFYRKAKKTR
jgi:transcriptional regulator with XRE-family HTH domain